MVIVLNQFSIWTLGKAPIVDFTSCSQEIQHVINFSNCRVDFGKCVYTVRFYKSFNDHKPNKTSFTFLWLQEPVTKHYRNDWLFSPPMLIFCNKSIMKFQNSLNVINNCFKSTTFPTCYRSSMSAAYNQDPIFTLFAYIPLHCLYTLASIGYIFSS